jgi:hypothetical protein
VSWIKASARANCRRCRDQQSAQEAGESRRDRAHEDPEQARPWPRLRDFGQIQCEGQAPRRGDQGEETVGWSCAVGIDVALRCSRSSGHSCARVSRSCFRPELIVMRYLSDPIQRSLSCHADAQECFEWWPYCWPSGSAWITARWAENTHMPPGGWPICCVTACSRTLHRSSRCSQVMNGGIDAPHGRHSESSGERVETRPTRSPF